MNLVKMANLEKDEHEIGKKTKLVPFVLMRHFASISETEKYGVEINDDFIRGISQENNYYVNNEFMICKQIYNTILFGSEYTIEEKLFLVECCSWMKIRNNTYIPILRFMNKLSVYSKIVTKIDVKMMDELKDQIHLKLFSTQECDLGDIDETAVIVIINNLMQKQLLMNNDSVIFNLIGTDSGRGSIFLPKTHKRHIFVGIVSTT